MNPRETRAAEDRIQFTKIGALTALTKSAEEATTFLLINVAAGTVRKVQGDGWHLVQTEHRAQPLIGDA
jgi:hypothetical protein